MPSIAAISASNAVISGPMMKRWLSHTRSMAARLSARKGRYCACRSSKGTPDGLSDIWPSILPLRFDCRPRLTVGFAALDRLALVVVLLAFRERHRHLDAAVLEIQPRRNERHSLLDGLADQLPNLVAMQQQLSPPQRFVVRVPAMAVGADVHVVEKDLAVFHPREAVAQVDAAFAVCFYFGAEQNEARLEALEQVEIVK